ncbi:NmrA family NAD(P)-binding protein [Mesorhizobium sp. M1066]|uniref:NmrA family NAD(P)-binding protein n=1 Tax=unclassified Mesorhizobium TaxID=325217 RepID=UPI00333B9369
MKTSDVRPVLVTGGTGGQGGSVVKKCIERGIAVRALVRDPGSASAQALEAAGADVVRGDFSDEASLDEAMIGVRGVFSMQQDGAPPSQFENLIGSAVSQGVEQYIHSTVSGVREREADALEDEYDIKHNYWRAKIAQERALRAATFRYRTYLRPSLIIDNFSLRASFLYPRLAKSGDLLVAMPPETRVSFVSYDTVGRVAAEAFADPERFDQAEIELADAFVSYRDIANILEEASGKTVTLTSVNADEAIAMGLPARVVDSHTWLANVGYPARPEMLARYNIDPLPIRDWVSREVAHIVIGNTR